MILQKLLEFGIRLREFEVLGDVKHEMCAYGSAVVIDADYIFDGGVRIDGNVVDCLVLVEAFYN
jgi:hypothetical protein